MAYTGKGLVVNRTGIADVLGCSEGVIDRYVREHCPVQQRGSRGKAWEFNTAHVIKWLRDKDRAQISAPTAEVSDLKNLQRRKLTAETVKAELELAKAKAEVALIADFERAQALVFAAIRTNVLNVPQRVVLQLLGETNETHFKGVLRKELTAALEQSAKTQFENDDDSDD